LPRKVDRHGHCRSSLHASSARRSSHPGTRRCSERPVHPKHQRRGKKKEKRREASQFKHQVLYVQVQRQHYSLQMHGRGLGSVSAEAGPPGQTQNDKKKKKNRMSSNTRDLAALERPPLRKMATHLRGGVGKSSRGTHKPPVGGVVHDCAPPMSFHMRNDKLPVREGGNSHM
jgi:hypothetical protein